MSEGRLSSEGPRPLAEIHSRSFNFCRCAVWSGDGAAAGQGGAPPVSSGGLRGVHIACAGDDPADVLLWRPGELAGPTARLRHGESEPKHGMCMALAFAPPARPAAATQAPGAASSRGSAPPPEGADGDDAQRSPDMQPFPAAPAPAAGAFGGGDDGGLGAGSSGAAVAGGRDGEGAADPRFVLAGYEDGVLALWDLRATGRALASLRVHSEPLMCLDAWAQAPSAKGSHKPAEAASPKYHIVSGSADSVVGCCVARPSSPRPLELAAQLPLREAGTADVRVRPDGRLFAAGCWDGKARLYSLRQREPLAVLRYHSSQLTAVAFSPGRMLLATASRDTTVALWDVYAKAGAGPAAEQ